MKTKHHVGTTIWIFIWIQLCFGQSPRIRTDAYGAPFIEDAIDEEYTVNDGEPLELRCTDISPITWVKIDEHNDNVTTAGLQVSHHANDTTHEAFLSIDSVSVYDVKFYYCIKEQFLLLAETVDDLENEYRNFHAAKVYLFVKDVNEPIVPILNPTITVKQFEQFVIPCKPSYKEIQVELARLDEDQQLPQIKHFDKKHGFTCRFRQIEDSDHYMCRVKGDPTASEQNFQIQVLQSCESNLIQNASVHGGSVVVGHGNNSKNNNVQCHTNNTTNLLFKTPKITMGDGSYTPKLTTAGNSQFYVNDDVNDDNEESYDESDGVYDYAGSSAYSDHEPQARTEFISTPEIQSSSNGIGLMGEKVSIECSVEIKQGVHYDIQFFHKRLLIKNEKRYTLSALTSVQSPHDPSKAIGRRTLTISNLEKSDTGIYKCEVQDHNNHVNENIIDVKVLSQDESILRVSTPQGEQIHIEEKGKLSIIFEYESFPAATYTVLFNGEQLHLDNYTAMADKTDKEINIQANEVTIENAGNYTVILNNGQKTAASSVFVYVRSKPLVALSPNETYIKWGTKAFLTCKVVGYPKSNIEWAFTKCTAQDWQSCIKGKSTNSIDDTDTLKEIDRTQDDSNKFAQIDHFGSIFKLGGIAKCTAENDLGSDYQSALIMVGDLDRKFMVWQDDPDFIITRDDPFTLHCGAIIYNYADNLEWFFNGEPVQTHAQVSSNATAYSYRSTLTLDPAQIQDSGTYECRARLVNDGSVHRMTQHVEIHEPETPEIVDTNLHTEVMVKLGESVEFYCHMSGKPKPAVLWYKNDELLDTSNAYDINVTDNWVRIPAVLSEHEGNYRCVGTNKVSTVEQTGQLIITNKPKIKNLLWWITLVLVLIAILIIVTIYLYIRVQKERKKVDKLKKAGLAHFEEGAIDQLNPDLDLNDQAELLPYDRRFEFPREKLKLGQQLGAGAFGVVIKATAQGIVPYEEESTVAIKMVKANTDDEIMRALVSELKIMVHLGQHLNVVNLLGAVTKNIAQREMMVIVEYCKFGNLQKFLLKHRAYFVDQIVPETDAIDPSITENEYRWSNNSVYNLRTSGATNTGHVNSKGYVVRNSANQGNMAIGVPIDSANTEATLISRDSERPFSTGYQSEYKGPVRPVSTTDLVCWAFQVARGMQYLASRKVLHGDLAARNILLCDDNIVKICDFGLARSLYNNDNYKKHNETPLPFKWLALESLSDQVFSTYSDVWAFGIVMWELFSLAQTPYPGIDPNRELYMKLCDGYRMEKPKYANLRLYDIMLACWNQKPETRPLFDELERSLGGMLHDGVKDHYIDLNEPYLHANSEYLKGTVDYLSMVAAPDNIAPSPPGQDELHEVTTGVPGYLNMRPKDGTAHYTQLSPFDQNATISPEDRPPEEIPMLQQAPRPKARKSVNSQYVNVPSELKRTKEDTVNNPGYVSVATSE